MDGEVRDLINHKIGCGFAGPAGDTTVLYENIKKVYELSAQDRQKMGNRAGLTISSILKEISSPIRYTILSSISFLYNRVSVEDYHCSIYISHVFSAGTDKARSKTGALVHFVDSKVRFNFDLYNLSGVALYGISFLLYVYLISKYDLGYIIPLTTAFVYTLILSLPFSFLKKLLRYLK